ncbi:hypothetical protein SISSUDRAFT_438379 [Sistotremastrum suecicum HHB10207 ss-3]|uniref:Uncharacterized protein n=1 Tax=Sistotremastrum suecicum HHB10207 ss-3 TaxID=1314776 RepID=A0A166FJ67_9AGAM|nr:hypothetical protein SISSUDRAFT_438379 [Sistotremastrum suecicum HHB10207 ss-3]
MAMDQRSTSSASFQNGTSQFRGAAPNPSRTDPRPSSTVPIRQYSTLSERPVIPDGIANKTLAHLMRRRDISRKSQSKRGENGRLLLNVVRSMLPSSEASQIRGQADAASVAATLLRNMNTPLVNLVLDLQKQTTQIEDLQAEIALLRMDVDAWKSFTFALFDPDPSVLEPGENLTEAAEFTQLAQKYTHFS